MDLDPERIEAAARYLEGRVRRTPLEPSPALSRRLGVPVYLKLESLQETGSFKLRGALFRLSRLGSGERRRGVAACSAGNHGWALARAGRELDVPVTVYVPATVDEVKYRGMIELGARVIRSRYPGYDATRQWAEDQSRRLGLPLISAYDDPDIMAANGGTLGREILEQLPQARSFFFPVGGGGLGAGLACLVRKRQPEALLVGCQHRDSAGLALSLEKGEPITSLPPIETSAGGIEGGIGRLTFPILRDRIDRVALVSEEEIEEGVRWMLSHHRHLVEPSAAAALAACLGEKAGAIEGPLVVILTGRNVALSTLVRILCRS